MSTSSPPRHHAAAPTDACPSAQRADALAFGHVDAQPTPYVTPRIETLGHWQVHTMESYSIPVLP